VGLTDDFATVQSAFLATPRGFSIRLDDSIDIIAIHHLGKTTVDLAAARGGNRRQPVPGLCIGPAPQVSYLAHERAVVLMNALGKFLKVRNN
jgi:hypothetical protein